MSIVFKAYPKLNVLGLGHSYSCTITTQKQLAFNLESVPNNYLSVNICYNPPVLLELFVYYL